MNNWHKVRAWVKIIGGAISLVLSGRIRLRDLTLSNVRGYIQGHQREYTAEGLPQHIKEQIVWRISCMNKNCLIKGECPCECQVPGKQFENRECEEGCYPPLLDEGDWKLFKEIYGMDESFDRIKEEARSRLKEFGYKLDFNIEKV